MRDGGPRRESVSVLRIMSAEMLRELPKGGLVIEDRAKSSKPEPVAVLVRYAEFLAMQETIVEAGRRLEEAIEAGAWDAVDAADRAYADAKADAD